MDAAIDDIQIEEEKRDSFHPYNSFNLTMEEEHKKIRNHTVYMQNVANRQNDTESKELIPCDFLRFVANVRDDLEHLAFQLDANHVDNFPEEEV